MPPPLSGTYADDAEEANEREQFSKGLSLSLSSSSLGGKPGTRSYHRSSCMSLIL